MAAEAADCITAGVSRMTIDLAVLGGIYAIANIEKRLTAPALAPDSGQELPAAHRSRNRSN